MVRDNPGRPANPRPTPEVQSQSQSAATAADSAAASTSTSQPPRAGAQSTEPSRNQLSLLNWTKLCISEEELDLWRQLEAGSDVDVLPTHLRLFSSPAEYKLVKHTYQQLQHSGYYWGPMTMETAHAILTHAPHGTFLIRDSGQTDVFFTLSYHSQDGPTSVRIILRNLLFSLYGSNKTFSSLFALLTYYTSSACKLTLPYRRQRPERLKQICRRAVVRVHGGGDLSALTGVGGEVKDYVEAYPHCI